MRVVHRFAEEASWTRGLSGAVSCRFRGALGRLFAIALWRGLFHKVRGRVMSFSDSVCAWDWSRVDSRSFLAG